MTETKCEIEDEMLFSRGTTIIESATESLINVLHLHRESHVFSKNSGPFISRNFTWKIHHKTKNEIQIKFIQHSVADLVEGSKKYKI